MTIYFGFAFSPAMLATFPSNVYFQEVDVAACKPHIEAAVSCLNPSHKATIDALEGRFGINVAIPETAPRVVLEAGDSMYILQVFGLPRLGADRKEYSAEEIAGATFKLLFATIS
jgi:hypothetical protein